MQISNHLSRVFVMQAVNHPNLQIFRSDREGMIDDIITHGV